MPRDEQFASDNYAGICPEAWQFMAKANEQDASAYGEDPWTQLAADRLRETFESDCEVFFVFNGTAANSLSLAAMCQSFHSVICHELAHVETDECGGPEYASNGSKLLVGTGPNGKLTPDSIEKLVTRRTDIHYPKPRVITLTQSTEVGTLYSIEELKAIREVADRHGLRIHMDGARFANAAAALGVSLPISPGAQASMSCGFRAPKTAWLWVKPSCFSIGNWQKILSGAASRPVSWRQKCDFSPHPGAGCLSRIPG